MTKNDARQFQYLVASPEDILPSMKPIGFPAPRAPVTLFLLLPSGYVVNSVPIAGGEMTAVPRPRKPQRTFIVVGFGAKAVSNENTVRYTMPHSSCNLRPNRSAVFPKQSMKEPLPRLMAIRAEPIIEDQGTYPIAADIHVT